MAVHALVVGCDSYPQVPGGDLRGAVADALAVAAWLAEHGGVAPQDLTLLAGPGPQGAQPDPERVHGPATRTALAAAVAATLARRDVGERDRLYVYVAGHGCRTDPDNPVLSRDVLALSDFSPTDPAAGSVGVEDLLERLRQSWYGEIVLLTDACRDLPFRRPFTPGGLGLDPEPPTARRHHPRCYLGQATVPGGTAAGAAAGAAVRGVFTTAVLAALAGDGAAKAYDETAVPPYVVRWSGLAASVEAALPAQRPRFRGEGELTLATFPDGSFAPVTLTVDVDPGEEPLGPDLLVTVTYPDPTAALDGDLRLPGPGPVVAHVPPRRHRVVATGGRAQGRVWADVYTDARVVVPLRRGGPATVPLSPDGPVRRSSADRSGELHLDTTDPAAVLEVRDAGARVLLTGVGSLDGALAPGSYTAVALDGQGREHTAVVEVERRRQTRAVLDVPPLPPGLHEGPYLSAAAVLALLQGRWPMGRAVATLVVAWSGRRDVDVTATWDRDGGWSPQQEPLSGRRVRGPSVPGLRHLTWAFPPGVRAALVAVGDHHLTVPILDGVRTAVSLRAAAEVFLYDDDALSDGEDHLLLLDRAQRLLAVDRRRAAGLVLGELTRRFPGDGAPRAVVPALVAAARQDRAHPQPHERAAFEALADALPPAQRSYHHPGSPWGVLLDRPIS